MAQRSPSIQYSFAAGMLDASLEARADLQSYLQGARVLKNMLSLSQGGVETRAGLKHVRHLPTASPYTRLAKFEYSTEQTYLIVFLDGEVQILHDDLLVATVEAPWSETDLPQLDWVQSLDTMILVHPEFPPYKLMRQGEDTVWDLSVLALSNVPTYQFSDEEGEEEEPTWSDARGWPRSVYLYEGRLYFGGSKARPQTIWGSKSGDFFNFATTEDVLDDEAVEMSLDGDRVSAVEQLYALNEFFCFSSGGVYAQSSSPVTPDNFYFSKQSEMPASAIRPVEMDGSLLFVSKGDDGKNKSVHELVWSDSDQMYQAQDLTILSSSLMQQPVDMAARRGDAVSSANHLFVVNMDGSCAVLHSRKSQNLTSWTRLETEGAFHRVAVVQNKPYFLVSRSFNGTSTFSIEVLDEAYRLDGAALFVAEVPQKVWQGLDFYEGQLVSVSGDNDPLGRMEVINGTLTLPVAVSKLEIGYDYEWQVETMPIEISQIDRTLVHRRYRIVKAVIAVEAGQFMTVNNRTVGGYRLGASSLDQKTGHLAGLITQRFLGWFGGKTGKRATINVEGRSHFPAKILNVIVEVAS